MQCFKSIHRRQAHAQACSVVVCMIQERCAAQTLLSACLYQHLGYTPPLKESFYNSDHGRRFRGGASFIRMEGANANYTFGRGTRPGNPASHVETQSSAPEASLTPDQANKLLKRDIANLVKKVASGRTLSATERAHVTAKAEGDAQAEGGGRWARNTVDLAKALGVHRTTIHGWRREKGAPSAATNGRHDIEAWRQWMRLNGKKAGTQADPDRAELQRRHLALQCDRLAVQIAELKREYTPNSQVAAELRSMIGGAHAHGVTMPAALAPQLAGLTVPEIEKRLRAWWDGFCTAIHTGAVAMS